MVISLKSGTARTLLLAGLVIVLLGMLIVFPSMMRTDLSAVVYSRPQQEYLNYNYGRTLNQAPATWNIVDDSIVVDEESGTRAPAVIGPALFNNWENHVQAALRAHYEEKSGVSVTVYDLDFRSEYQIEAPEQPTAVELIFPFPGNLDTLHEVQLRVNGVEPPGVQYTTQMIRWQAEMEPGKTYIIVVTYKAEGVNEFQYGLYKDRRLSELDVTVDVKGLRGTEVLETSLPTTDQSGGLSGDSFTWQYSNLVGNRDIQLELPQRLSFAQRVARLQDDFRMLGVLAPVWVGLFLLALAGLLWLDDIRLPFEAYVLLGLGLALFYPLLTFLSSLMPLFLAAGIAVVMVAAAELLFLSLSPNWAKIVPRAAWLLLIVMGLLSLGILTSVRGLLLTVGALLLVATFMVFFARRSMRVVQAAVVDAEPEPESEVDGGEPAANLALAESEADSPLATGGSPAADMPLSESVVFERHCPNCGRALGAGDHFCAGCGYDLQQLRVCNQCGYEQVVPVDTEVAHCLNCGNELG